MSRDRILFIHNPTAGASGASAMRSNISAQLESIRKTVGAKHEWIETGSGDEARDLTEDASRRGIERIVAVGGDGTVHEVINGLMRLPLHKRPTLGVLAIGSGNDFAFACGAPADIHASLDAILRGNSKPVDIGRVEDNRGHTEYFDNTLGIGFDAYVTIEAKKIRKLQGFARYFAATLKTIARHHTPFEVELLLDRHRLHERALMITLGNGPREGGGFMTTPQSRIDDGKFEVLLIKPISRPMMLALLPKVLRGSHLSSPSVFCKSINTMSLSSKGPLCIHMDGEILADPTTDIRDLRITLEAHAIRVLA
jgi:diacylglycerol kinase (ATP)